MKKIGIFLLTIFLWMGVNAQHTVNNEAADTTSVSKSTTEYVEKAINDAMSFKLDNIENDNYPETKFVGTILFLVIGLPVLIVFGAVVLIVYFSNKSRREKDKIRQEIYLKALEAGQTLPADFFEVNNKTNKPPLQNGLVLLGIGIFFLIIALITGNNGLYYGTIVGFIGVGRLIAYFVEKKHNKEK